MALQMFKKRVKKTFDKQQNRHFVQIYCGIYYSVLSSCNSVTVSWGERQCQNGESEFEFGYF